MNRSYRFYRAVLVSQPPSPSGMEFIPAGSLLMGEGCGDIYPAAGPVHSVVVSAFHMDKYEVTKALWDEVNDWAKTKAKGFSKKSSNEEKCCMKPTTSEWGKKAEDDFKAASQLLRRCKDIVPDAACFFWQQCAKKYLKFRLIEVNIGFPRMHDFRQLLNLCLPVEPLWSSYVKVMDALSDYAVDFRYPGHSATVVEARKCLQNCMAVPREVRLRNLVKGPSQGLWNSRVACGESLPYVQKESPTPHGWDYDYDYD